MRTTLDPLHAWIPELPIAIASLSKGITEKVDWLPSSVFNLFQIKGSISLPVYASSQVDLSKYTINLSLTNSAVIICSSVEASINPAPAAIFPALSLVFGSYHAFNAKGLPLIE